MTKYEYVTEVLKILPEEIESYGKDKFKISLKLQKRLKDQKNGKLILVSSINPTSSGEGKTTVSIGLAQGFKKNNERVMIALREPSMGPVFGMKGGATGGGKSELEPAWDINLHFNGDLHALTAANNLLSALIDNHIHFGNELKIKEVYWQRALDVNDRSLRSVETKTRKDGFQITAASEMMAILALSKDFTDLKVRLSNILIGVNEDDENIYVKDLGCQDALSFVLKDAIKPNLVFSKEMVPAFVHAGPFANIAHGCNSLIATSLALKLADYVITEAGFGADLGMEKFLHIKQKHLPTDVSVVVVVATIKALKLHGGMTEDTLDALNLEALKKGLENIEKHIENITMLGLRSVVALNKFESDHDKELKLMEAWAEEKAIKYGISEGFMLGGEGTKALASLVKEEADKGSNFQPLYQYSDSIEDKVRTIVTKMYGGNDVTFSKRARRKMEQFKDLEFPICMAKTPLSLTQDASIKGRPTDFVIDISDIKISYGAKLIVALTKGISTMPGLNSHPRALDFRVDDEGELKI